MLCTNAEILIALGKTGTISAADQDLLSLVKPLAESSLKQYLQQNLEYAQTVEYLPIGLPRQIPDSLPAGAGDIEFTATRALFVGGRAGSEALQLKNLPVASVGLEVREDVGAYAGQASGAWGSDTILTAGEDFYLDMDYEGISHTGLLFRIGQWPTEPRSVKVTYYGGYSATQMGADAAGAIKLAAIETVVAAFKRAKDRQNSAGPKTSETIGVYSYSTSAQLAADANGVNHDIPYSAMMRLSPYRNFGRLFA